MVCSIGSGKMTALSRLLDAGSVSQNVKAKEEIGHQKLAAQYIKREIQEADEANLLDEDGYEYFWFEADDRSFEFELCRTLSSEEVLYPELDGPIVNKKPPRKERKKSTQTRDMHLTTTHIMNGSIVNPYDMHCSEDATKGSSISLKRTATENPSNPCTKNLCKTAAEVRPYAPRDDNCSHLAQTPDQILAARADCYIGKSGGLVPTMNTASHLPVNNALGSHYSSKSYSFAGESGKPLGTLQQGNESVSVL
ncbi:hypothetical protein OROMI_005876 [Orobanche minor]